MTVRRLASFVPLLAGIVVLAYLYRIFGVQELGQAFERMQPFDLALYGLISAVILLSYAGRWALVSAATGARTPLPNLIAARLAGDAIGTLLPGGRLGGDPYRVALLYSHGVGGVAATAGVAADRMLEMTGNTVAAITYVVLYSAIRAAHVSLALTTTLVIFFLATVATVVTLWQQLRPFSRVLTILLPNRPRPQKIIDTMRRIEDELASFFRNHPAAFVTGLLASLIIEVCIVVQYHLMFSAFGLHFDLPTVLMVLLGGGAARAIPAPAGLGVLEASQVTVMALISGRPDVGFVVGMVLRLHETLWLLLGLAAMSVYRVTPKRLRARFAESVP